ncbi:MAG TPA: hypothetical protein VHD61_15785 [Lacunisphaera sp.]|nr:hypothetical protein [Lacunisphaera sp.]
MTSIDLTNDALAQATAAGWQIVSRDAAGVQFRKPKEWSKAAVILGLVLLIFYGFGLLILLLAALDYAMAKDKLIYVPADQLARDGWKAAKQKAAVTVGGLFKTAAIIIGLIVGVTVLVGLAMR